MNNSIVSLNSGKASNRSIRFIKNVILWAVFLLVTTVVIGFTYLTSMQRIEIESSYTKSLREFKEGYELAAKFLKAVQCSKK